MNIKRIISRVIECCGVPNWWPSNDPFEISVQAILTQNTSWKNVVKATERLKESGLLSPYAIYEANLDKIANAIKPSGFYRIKAQRLKEFVKLVVEDLDGDIRNLKRYPLEEARKMLLSIKGIGFETADTILLFALDFSIMVVDAYTKRVLKRAGVDIPEDYERIRILLENNSPRRDPETFKLLHSGFDELAKNYCKKNNPRCDNCPISDLCSKQL